MTMREVAPDWDDVLDALRSADEIVVACHVNPDGDALGSLLACALGLTQLGKKSYPTWGEAPVMVPLAYEFLPGIDRLLEHADVPSTDTFLALDCAAADRLGELEARARATPSLINIDHHRGNGDFGKFNVVVPTASSTAEIVTRLLIDLGVELDTDLATCLYTGIVTDTGRFQYANSSPDTLRLAADLLERGVPAPAIAQEIFESSPWGYLKLLGRVLDRAVLFEEERFVYSSITLADLSETGVALNETEKVIDQVRATRAADIAALFKEQADGSWRVSLRSKAPRTVGAVARAWGGGGHDLAAGFTAPDVERTVEQLRKQLR